MTDPCLFAFCMPRRHRHPGLHCFRRSIPRPYALLSTLRVLPHGSVPRMTRGQCGSLLLHCNGLSPSTSADLPGAPWLNHKPHAIAVYASWPALPSAHATLAIGRPATALPAPVFHRLDCTSLAGAFGSRANGREWQAAKGREAGSLGRWRQSRNPLPPG